MSIEHLPNEVSERSFNLGSDLLHFITRLYGEVDLVGHH